MAAEFMPAVEPGGVGAQKPFHASHQIALGCFNYQMKMIGHQTIGMHLPVCFRACFSKGFQKAYPILII